MKQVYRENQVPLEQNESQVDLPAPQTETFADSLDEILADIDESLEANTLSFVQGFKQKGGQ